MLRRTLAGALALGLVATAALAATWLDSGGTQGVLSVIHTIVGGVATPVSTTNPLPMTGSGTPGSPSGGVVTIQDSSGGACQNQTRHTVPINLTASGQLFAGTSAKKNFICSLNIITATAQNIALVEGTGTVCATNIYGLAGGTTAATGWNFAANGGLTQGNGHGFLMGGDNDTNGAAANVCLLLSGAGQVSGALTYAQQ